ncbi:MAG: helix-turn-helix transcriptional regulator [Lachnospiraceae bacterium]|nr:helix-turn-helix transcriptional regulator [Lachnospiraceae bacterium]
MFDIKVFSLRLAQLRDRKDVSARQMSLDLGLNSGYIQNIESGKALPRMAAFMDICEYLEVTPSEFFDMDAKDPAKLQGLMEDLRQLDEEQLDSIAVLVKGLKKK